ncbi:EAL domain-containing protein [Alkalibacillus salilacus]|uniref:EAL domain-containing protein (Putative c-di-GMP-specific phosphodiesterase class I) n=1 Tax=Alkalibacillus salilacus TaxID=284582 RepID=A0ABT9VJ97_9BACI|nr:EAL domain-containing protein [Alkalibacillus salilacus]MDQ0160925.1 EAL domain-containing protein (putative c-di-GMP-specific phosphodiesterase class I) [Alkalibacillus salilacus]
MGCDTIAKVIDHELVYHHFQPIYNLTSNESVGYEALLRTDLFGHPGLVFDAAYEIGRLHELDRLSIKQAILTYSSNQYFEPDQRLFINVFPSNIMDSTFAIWMRDLLDASNVKPHQVVIEINEQEPSFDHRVLRDYTSILKLYGFHIALDDVGKGSASLQAMIELEPNIVKMDRYFSRGLTESFHKQALLNAFVAYADETKTDFILEGVESSSELSKARALDVTLAQGFYLCRPQALDDLKHKPKNLTF